MKRVCCCWGDPDVLWVMGKVWRKAMMETMIPDFVWECICSLSCGPVPSLWCCRYGVTRSKGLFVLFLPLIWWLPYSAEPPSLLSIVARTRWSQLGFPLKGSFVVAKMWCFSMCRSLERNVMIFAGTAYRANCQYHFGSITAHGWPTIVAEWWKCPLILAPYWGHFTSLSDSFDVSSWITGSNSRDTDRLALQDCLSSTVNIFMSWFCFTSFGQTDRNALRNWKRECVRTIEVPVVWRGDFDTKASVW